MADGTVELLFKVDTRSAGGALSNLSKDVEKVGASAKKTQTEVAHLNRSAKDLEEGAGRADSVMQGLASALGLVSPQAAEAARTIGDTAGGVEALARGIPISLGPIAALSVAIAGLAAVYYKLSQNLKEVEERNKRLADQATAAADRARRIDTIRLRAQVARGEITETEAASISASREAASLFAPDQQAVRDQLSAAQARLTEISAPGQRVTPQLVQEQNALRGQIQALNTQLKTLDLAVANTAADILEGGLKPAAEQASKGLRAVGKAAEDVAAPTRARVGGIGNATITDANGNFIGAFGGTEQANPLRITGPGGQVLGGPTGAAISGVESRRLTAADALGGAGQVLSGGGLGLLSGLGPVGMGVGLLGQLGAQSGQETAEMIGETIGDVLSGLFEALPELIIALPGEIAKALFGLPVKLLRGLGRRSRERGFAAIESLQEGGSVADIFQASRDPQSRDIGSRSIPHAGLYMLHGGEEVLPPGGNNGQTQDMARSRRGGGGGSIVINVGTAYNGVDSVIRDLDKRLGTFGGGYSRRL